MAKQKRLRFLSGALACLTFLTGFGVTGYAAADGDAVSEEAADSAYEVGSLDKILTADSYTEYLAKHATAPAGKDGFAVDVTKYDKDSTTATDVKVLSRIRRGEGCDLPSFQGRRGLEDQGAVHRNVHRSRGVLCRHRRKKDLH